MDESEDPATPATPDLFNGSYYSDGRATPDDTSSLDGMTTTTACQPKRKRRGRPPVYLSGEPMDGWTDLDKGTQYKVGGKSWSEMAYVKRWKYLLIFK